MQVIHAREFSAFEFLASIGIVSFLALVATSIVSVLVADAPATAIRSELVSSVLQASRHAANTGTPTVLCPTRDGAACTEGNDWSQGWLGFADLNGDRRYDPGDRLLHRAPPLAGGLRLCTQPGLEPIVFHPRGGTSGGNVGFTVCDSRCPDRAGSMVLTVAGRLRLGEALPEAAAHCAV